VLTGDVLLTMCECEYRLKGRLSQNVCGGEARDGDVFCLMMLMLNWS